MKHIKYYSTTTNSTDDENHPNVLSTTTTSIDFEKYLKKFKVNNQSLRNPNSLSKLIVLMDQTNIPFVLEKNGTFLLKCIYDFLKNNPKDSFAISIFNITPNKIDKGYLKSKPVRDLKDLEILKALDNHVSSIDKNLPELKALYSYERKNAKLDFPEGKAFYKAFNSASKHLSHMINRYNWKDLSNAPIGGDESKENILHSKNSYKDLKIFLDETLRDWALPHTYCSQCSPLRLGRLDSNVLKTIQPPNAVLLIQNNKLATPTELNTFWTLAESRPVASSKASKKGVSAANDSSLKDGVSPTNDSFSKNSLKKTTKSTPHEHV